MALAGSGADPNNLNNLKDILLTYNKLTDVCFSKCVSNLNYRDVTQREEICIDRCSGKFIAGNQRMMTTFVEIQSHKQQQLYEETIKREKEALENQQNTSVSTEQIESSETNSKVNESEPAIK